MRNHSKNQWIRHLTNKCQHETIGRLFNFLQSLLLAVSSFVSCLQLSPFFFVFQADTGLSFQYHRNSSLFTQALRTGHSFQYCFRRQSSYLVSQMLLSEWVSNSHQALPRRTLLFLWIHLFKHCWTMGCLQGYWNNSDCCCWWQRSSPKNIRCFVWV